jgi:hypothetical protein
MDLKIFTRLVIREYKQVDSPYTLDDVLFVFATFFKYYLHYRGEEHPLLRPEQVRRIIDTMPYFTDIHGDEADIDPEDYEPMIQRYFATPFENCDYRINHFFSGDIRMMRFYESGLY